MSDLLNQIIIEKIVLFMFFDANTTAGKLNWKKINSKRKYNTYFSYKEIRSHFYGRETHEQDSDNGEDCRKSNRTVEWSFAILYSCYATNDIVKRI